MPPSLMDSLCCLPAVLPMPGFCQARPGISGQSGAHPRTVPGAPVCGRLKAKRGSTRLAIFSQRAGDRDAQSRLQAGAPPVLLSGAVRGCARSAGGSRRAGGPKAKAGETVRAKSKMALKIRRGPGIGIKRKVLTGDRFNNRSLKFRPGPAGSRFSFAPLRPWPLR
jgi:hypothetical protein